MSKIYKTSDRLPVKIGDITFKVSPLTFQQRSEINACITHANRELDFAKMAQSTFLAVKYAIKEISTIATFEGESFELKFDEDGTLCEETCNDLLNLEISPELSAFATNLLAGVPDKILDEDGKPVKGIKLLYTESKRPNPKNPKKK